MINALSSIRRFTGSRPRPASWEVATDVELAVAVRAQDRAGKEAFVEIVRRHQTTVAAVAYGVTGRIGLTDDIAQETFLRAWKRLGTLREPGKLKPWLTRIAHDCAVDALRREKPASPLDDEMVSLTEAAERSPDQAMAKAEEEAMVWSALEALPETLRLPLVLFYREGKSAAAVAAALDISEDAVKQRLSRGREALREQVVARIEGVLARVKPGPQLLVAVAAGIGLSAAPEAVAAAAMSGKTTGAASTAAPWITAAAALALAAPLGWNARGLTASRNPASGGSVALPADPLAELADSALLREWRRLLDIHGRDAAAMPAIFEAIQSLPRDFHRRALRRVLLTEWSRLDPAAGFDFLLAKNQTEHARVLMQDWLRSEGDDAARALAQHAMDAPELARSLLTEVATHAPRYLAALAESIPPPKDGFHAEVAGAFAVWAARHPDAARDAAESMVSAQRQGALAGVAAGWAERDGASALAWSLSLPEDQGHEEAARAALAGWAVNDPFAALDHMKDVPADYREDYRVGVLRAAVQRDFDMALRWLSENCGRINNSQLWDELAAPLMTRFHADQQALLLWMAEQPEAFRKGLFTALATGAAASNEADQVAVWSWLDTLPDSTPGGQHAMREMRRWLMDRCGPRVEALAFEWMKTLPQDKWESRSFIERWTESASRRSFEGHAAPGRQDLERMAAEFPPALRPGFYPALLKGKTDWHEADLTRWAQWIAEAPDMDRGRLAAKVADSIGAVSPEAAAAWALELPGGTERHAAMRAAVGIWSRVDAASSSEWVNELPRGASRDEAASALVNSIAASEPDAAWAWMLDIAHDRERQAAAQIVLAAVHRNDPARARLLARSPDLPEAARAWFKRKFIDRPEAESGREGH